MPQGLQTNKTIPETKTVSYPPQFEIVLGYQELNLGFWRIEIMLKICCQQRLFLIHTALISKRGTG